MTRAQRSLTLWLAVALILVAFPIAAPILPLQSTVAIDIPGRFDGPSAEHWLGQDELGRDVLSRIIWGARASLIVAFGSAFFAAVIGTILGLVGGYFRGLAEILAVRSTEIIICLPPLLLALLVITILGAGIDTLIMALTILFVPKYTRVVYAATLQTGALDFVTAQESMGTHPMRILARTVLPNIFPPLLVQFSLTVASGILLESGLSFLGLGVVPPAPSWGLMIRAARAALDVQPLLLLWPSLALAGTVLLLNVICDRLQEVITPRTAERGGAAWLRRQLGLTKPEPVADDTPLLAIRDLSVAVSTERGTIGLTDTVGFTLKPGETMALVGESGSGKTLTGLATTGLLPNALKITNGSALFRDCSGTVLDLAKLTEDQFRPLRGNDISMVFQDASASLNPVHRIGDQLAEVIAEHRKLPRAEIDTLVVDLLRRVGIPDPEQRRRAYPFELSGGQRQRAMIAMAIANSPRLLIADEPTTALDPTIQAQILRLLDGLKDENRDMGMIFVTHNLAVVKEIADTVSVMYAGEVVEQGSVAEIFERPRHPYTAALLASVPESESTRLESIPGTVPRAGEMPEGCRFAPRCKHAADICASVDGLQTLADGRRTACIRWETVT